ncbi:MAG: DUF3391 domain-containing protein [Sphingomonadales bacterium]|nr:DUF3391 domain-containing protein [Sphingomonadales bacterium]MDE2568664.1 DUF3391 domain-containing protein [Sphingomonadales bacterium]
MLKRISLDEVRLGMFIQKLEGSWLKHPFWKTKFVISDERQLEDLMASDLDGIVIDVSKGRDVDVPHPRRSLQAGAPSPALAHAAARARPPERPAFANPRPISFGTRGSSPQHASMRREFGTAKRIAGHAEKATSRIFLESRLGKAINPQSVEPVVDEIFESIQRDANAFGGLMRCKSGAPSVYRHSVAVSALMVSLAIRMKLHPRDIRIAGLAGLLMDIGQAHLEASSAEAAGERHGGAVDLQRRHVVLGHEILSASTELPEEVRRVCLYHHERLDGSGFPLGLRDDKIDSFSRMAAICDTFDELVSLDGGGPLLDPARALQNLADARGKFDPEILNFFIDSVGTFPIGSIVELRSGKLAMIVCSDAEGSDLPTVRTFYSLVSNKPLRGENIDLRNCYGQDKIVATASLRGLDIRQPETLRERLITAAIKDDF